MKMAQLGFNWPIATMKGKACGHDDTYVKTDRITGKSYAVKLCNPVTVFNADQKAAQTKFANLSNANGVLQMVSDTSYKFANGV